MAGKTGKADKSGISVWRIVSTLFFLVVLIVWCLYHANFVTGRSLQLAFPGWDVSYKSCWPNPFGGTWVSDVTLIPLEDDEEEVFHFEHLTVDADTLPGRFPDNLRTGSKCNRQAVCVHRVLIEEAQIDADASIQQVRCCIQGVAAVVAGSDQAQHQLASWNRGKFVCKPLSISS